MMMPFTVTVIIFLIEWCLTFGTGCPNAEFTLIAYEGEEFSLPNDFKSSYLSFGAEGFYSLQIISLPKGLTHDAKAQCNKETWGFVPNTEEQRKKNVCCVGPLIPASSKHPLLPSYITTEDNIQQFVPEPSAISKQHETGQYGYHQWQWMRFQRHHKHGIYEYILTKTVQKKCDDFAKDISNKQRAGSSHGKWKKYKYWNCSIPLKPATTASVLEPILMQTLMNNHVPAEDNTIKPKMCYPSIEKCDTKNLLSLTVFVLSKYNEGYKNGEHPISQYFKYGFSKTGIFNVKKLFIDINWNHENDDAGKEWPEKLKIGDFNNRKNGYKIEYYSMHHFGDKIRAPKVSLHAAEHDKVDSGGWQLVSFCAACPEQTVQISRTKQETKARKDAIKSAQTNGFTVGGEIEMGGSGIINSITLLPIAKFKGEGSHQYTDELMNELSEELQTSGTLQIDYKCTGFYVYNFIVVINFWSGNFENIPTPYFYCTDRREKPQCLPKLVTYTNKIKQDTLPICNGYDTDIDFDPTKTEQVQKAWRSHHYRLQMPQYNLLRANPHYDNDKKKYQDTDKNGKFLPRIKKPKRGSGAAGGGAATGGAPGGVPAPGGAPGGASVAAGVPAHVEYMDYVDDMSDKNVYYDQTNRLLLALCLIVMMIIIFICCIFESVAVGFYSFCCYYQYNKGTQHQQYTDIESI